MGYANRSRKDQHLTLRKFTVNADTSCTVKNVIYVIKCRGGGEYYIGETNSLRKRTTLHNEHIRHESSELSL